MVDIVGPTQAKSATANGAVLDKDLNRIWYERLRSNVNYGKPQDRQYVIVRELICLEDYYSNCCCHT